MAKKAIFQILANIHVSYQVMWGYLWMHTDEMDHIQRELAQLEPWGKNITKNKQKMAKNGQHFGVAL